MVELRRIGGDDMKSRMDKYERSSSKNHSIKRTNKNQDLYQNFYTNTRYTDLNSYEDDHVVDFESSKNNMNKRSDYHKVKDYQNLIEKKEINTKDDLKKYLEEDHKIYDINRIIANAKKNRKEQEEEIERKRKLRNSDYNIFEGTTLEELKQRKKKIEEEKEKIDEMINTISSDQLREDIDNEIEKDLFSDLMPTQTKKEALAEEVKKLMAETEDLPDEEEKEPTLKDIDRSFYTKSMDLTDADFEMDDDLERELNKNHTFLKIVLVLILFAVIGVAVYLIMMRK